ncbi:IS4 family transposase [Thiocapsa sp.]|uniref:IS4 family transposase n=1 Tax=Thiocapsa sp. TaxID=2024551 RepID=UPI00261DD952|nr:IS4 family transposase [Thiocapsa sp.]
MLAPHIACTVERIREHPRVLCIEDTSELDYTGKNDIQGPGPLNYETRRGLYLHPTLAVTPDRLALGLLHAHTWVREPGSLAQPKDAARPIEEKESLRWIDGFARVNELAEQLPETRLTYLADREADIYELFVEAPCPDTGADWLVRGQHDRVLGKDAEGNPETLRQRLDQAPVLTETCFDQPGGNGRTARTVHQQIKAVRLKLPAPYRRDRKLAEIEITAILATELQPPPGEDPVEWLLLTNLPVTTPEQALE